MKHSALLLLAIGVSAACAQELQVLERGAHHQVIQRVQSWQDPGGVTRFRTNQVTELADDLCYPTTQGWELTQQSFVPVEGGFLANQGPLKVFLHSNLNLENAVEVLSVDGKVFECSPVFVALRDGTGQSVLVAAVQDAQGRLVAPNVVQYDLALDGGLDAAVRYSYTRRGLEQDLLLFDPASQLVPEDYGLEAASCFVELWSEFVSSPEAQIIPIENNGQVDDVTIQFGSTRIAQGKAFSTDNEELAIRVRKRFGDVEGRRWLVEMVPLASALALFEQSGQGAAAPVKGSKIRQMAKRKVVKGDPALVAQVPPRRRVARSASVTPLPRSSMLASAPANRRSFVLDFQLFNTTNLTNFRFQGDRTHHIAGAVTLSGTSVWEAGSVLKYTNGAKVKVTGPVDFQGSPWRPVVMTSIDDSSVGEVVRTNALSGYYADTALELDATAAGADFLLRNLRIAYATNAVKISGRTGHAISHAQFVNCKNGVVVTNATSWLRNVLVYGVTTPFTGAGSTLRGEHLTVDAATTLNGNTAGLTLLLTNSLVTGVTTTNGFGGAGIVVLASSTGVYEVAGAGGHYLAKGSPYRNTATATISSTLADELKKLTTYAPTILKRGYVGTSALTYGQTVQRDTDVPDCGAHYDPIDYAVGGLVIANGANVKVGPGVVMAGYQDGGGLGYIAWVDYGGKLTVEGRADNPARFVWYTSAQETAGTSWQEPSYGLVNALAQLTPSTPPELSFKFTEWVVLGSAAPYPLQAVGPATGMTPITINHSTLHGGQLHVEAMDVRMTNLFLNRVDTQVWFDGGPTNAQSFLRSTLHYGGVLASSEDLTNAFSVRDAIFYQSVLTSGGGGWDNGYNGYHTNGCTNCFVVAKNVGTNHIASISFLSGALGSFYLPTTSHLVNTGSVANASTVGLYHFTTDTNQVREGTGKLDIGYHSLTTASSTSTSPKDGDGDGIPDYLEDLNLSGTVDAGETDFTTYTSQYGIGSGPGLVTFTPLK